MSIRLIEVIKISDNVYKIKFEDEHLGTVHNPGTKESVYFGVQNYEIDFWQLQQIVLFMEVGPCPECDSFVNSSEVILYCTKCAYRLGSG